MNTVTIATLYPFFLDSLRQASAAQTMEALLVRRLQADQVPTSRSYSHSIALTDIDHPGQPTEWLAEAAGVTMQEFAPARVFNWVCQQLPTLAADYQPKPVTGWQVYLQATTRGQAAGPDLHLYANATSAELTTVLRGLRAYQAKRAKQAHRLLAQLRAYHAQQLAAEARRAELLVAAATSPMLPHYSITRAEYGRRFDAADDLARQLREQYNRPDAHYGHDIMWHPDFPTACVESFSQMELHEVEYFLSGNLAKDFYRDQPLDYADYAYLADCLREGLADNPTPLAALRLTRALTWVEQTGAALLATAPAALPSEAAAPVLRAAA